MTDPLSLQPRPPTEEQKDVYVDAFCGTPESLTANQGHCKWPDGDIPWTVTALPVQQPLSVVRAIYERAFGLWERVCGIRARFVPDPAAARIHMGAGHIDGPSNVLAWSELPCGGVRSVTQRYDTGEQWALDGESGIRLVVVACHEIGHALGIPHISAGNLMQPSYSGRISEPQAGDIREAIARYGPPTGVPPVPDPTPIPPQQPDWIALLNALLALLRWLSGRGGLAQIDPTWRWVAVEFLKFLLKLLEQQPVTEQQSARPEHRPERAVSGR
jgi:hypothetical protein